jgi:4-hydroxybenzoate polyprenyltransferase
MKMATALRLGRVSNLPTTWTNVAAGLVLSGAAPARQSLLLGLCAAASCSYVGGMYLNDAFDRDYDVRERPERPIPAGEVSAGTVFALGFLLLALGIALVAGIAFSPSGQGVAPVLAALALAALIVFYDAYHKGNPLSPVVMALNRVLLYVTAAWSARVAFGAPLAWGTGAVLCYLIGLTYAAKQENLREPRSLWPLVFLQVPFLYAPAFMRGTALVSYALLFGWVGYSLSFLLDQRRRNVKRAVSYLIAGISLLDGMLVASAGESLVAALCVAGFLATLFLQRFVPGT